MPGEPTGIPGTDSPMIDGFSFNIRWMMPFDDITIDHSGMAGMQPARHSVLAFNIRELLSESILLLDLETVCLQVTHPIRAAASRRVRIHRYRWPAQN